MQSSINHQNVSRYFTISTDLHGLLAPEESLHLKNHGPCCQKHFLSEHYKTLQICYICKYLEILYAKGQGNLQRQQLNINL